jgi:hypothetical protein
MSCGLGRAASSRFGLAPIYFQYRQERGRRKVGYEHYNHQAPALTKLVMPVPDENPDAGQGHAKSDPSATMFRIWMAR